MRRFAKSALFTIGAALATFAIVSGSTGLNPAPAKSSRATTFCSSQPSAATFPRLNLPTLPPIPTLPSIPCIPLPTLPTLPKIRIPIPVIRFPTSSTTTSTTNPPLTCEDFDQVGVYPDCFTPTT